MAVGGWKGGGLKVRCRREVLCLRGVYFHGGVVELFLFFKFFILLFVTKHGYSVSKKI